MRFVATAGDTVFTLASIGVEKTLKVFLGCSHLAHEGTWLDLKRKSHDVVSLNQMLMKAITQHLSQSTASDYTRSVAERITESRLLPLMLATFARYGQSGRFHHLDILAGRSIGELEPPAQLWDAVELEVRASNSRFAVIPVGDNEAMDEDGRQLRAVISRELDVWWFCVCRLAMQGVLGDLARTVQTEVWNLDRPDPDLEPGRW